MKQYYKIISLENTKLAYIKKYGNYNEIYNRKYIGQIGYIVGHYLSDIDIFKNCVCLITQTDNMGRPIDGHWFHVDDLEKLDRKEDVLIFQR